MGAWGPGIFENDDASDWVWELEDDDDGSVLIEALSVVVDLDPDEDPEADESCNALAAAEIVAAARGRHSVELPSEAREWVARNAAKVDHRLVALAAGAVERVSIASELKELWDEAQDDSWSLVVRDLLDRLRSA
jgi:hypothetical protein